MFSLATLKNLTRPRQSVKRVGRGLGSGLGKTCGRGEKGAGARSGYKRRLTYEGGQFRLFMKIPIRGFNNARFRTEYEPVNLGQINDMYNDGEVVNFATLSERGFMKGRGRLVKVLGTGELHKKVTLEVDAYSESAKRKLTNAKITFRSKKED